MEVKKKGLAALTIVLALTLALALVVTACGRATPTPIPTASPGLQTPLPTQLTPDPTPTPRPSLTLKPTATPTPTTIPTPTFPVPPTHPVPGPTPGPLTTPGYVYDDELGYGFDYPGGWEMQIPEVVDGEDGESILMLTKPGTPTTLVVIVRLSDSTTLEEVKVELREAVEGIGATIFEERGIVASGREGYEVIYSPFPSVKMRQAMFLANGKSYALVCSTADQLYDEYEETFDSIIGSFKVPTPPPTPPPTVVVPHGGATRPLTPGYTPPVFDTPKPPLTPTWTPPATPTPTPIKSKPICTRTSWSTCPTATPTPLPTPSTVPFEWAWASITAMMHAASCGLKGEPTWWDAQRMTLGEYHVKIGALGPISDDRVWVVSLCGDIDWSCPGPPPYPIEVLVVVVDPPNGRIIATHTYRDADDSPFSIPPGTPSPPG